MAYILGERAFYDRVLSVTPDVLIPRPETELLIELALDWARARSHHHPGEPLRIADVGAGSGAIAVTLAAHLPGADVWAVDVSAAAVEIARQNAARGGVAGRVRLVRGDLLVPLIDVGAQVDLIAANLPYIPSAEVDHLPVARHEPRLALDGGPDGLVLIAALLADAPRNLAPGGTMLLEMQYDQGPAIHLLAERILPGARISVLTDLAGLPRLVRIERREEK
jgi:release factor glutamine methyltransferase